MQANEEELRHHMAIMAESELEDDDYYDDLSDLPPGFRFDPTDEELLGFYLRRKSTGMKIPRAMDSAIPTLDLFAPGAAPPWLLHPATLTSSVDYYDNSGVARCVAPRDATEWFYCFARTTRRGSGSCRTTESGTWLTSGTHKEVNSRGDAVGYKSGLAFRVPVGAGAKGASTSWVMHEFKTHREKRGAPAKRGSKEEPEELVLCRMRCTKRMGREENTMQGKRQRTSGANELPDASPGNAGSQGGQQISSDVGDDVPLASIVPVPHDSAVLKSSDSYEEDLWEGMDLGPIGSVQEFYHGNNWQLIIPEEDNQMFPVGTPELGAEFFELGFQDDGFVSFAEEGVPPAGAAAPDTSMPAAGAGVGGTSSG